MHQTLVRLISWLVIAALLLTLTPPAGAGPRAQGAPEERVLLPLVVASDTFAATPALWPHAAAPAAHEVALFRCTLSLGAALSGAELQIFADTRYQAWLGGQPLGRGPARFSQLRREYDTYALGDLGPGGHTLAVLAQWAPNTRRSESLAPQIQARVVGGPPDQRRLIALGPDGCRSLRSPAWRGDPAPLQTWGVLGPSELLDLGGLPQGWQQPGFDDSGWARPAVRPSGAPRPLYQPRSIAPLAEVPIDLRLHAAGRLGPGARLGELVAGREGAAEYQFSLAAPATVTIQALALPGQPDLAEAATLDGSGLSWAPVAGAHPDLRQATRRLAPGSHRLRVVGLAAGDSWVFSISPGGAVAPAPPWGGGASAGRRTLIPQLSADSSVVTVGPGPGLSLSLAGGPAYIILDLGRTVHGRLVAEASGPAGALIDIGWDERLFGGSRPLPFPGSLHPQWNQVDSWSLAGPERTLTTLDTRAGRYILITSWSDQPVSLRNIRVREERYPLELRGGFSSGSPRLDRIWQVGVDTLYSNMNDAYADAWRERGQWWGDAHIADQAAQVAFGDPALLRRGLLQIGDSARGGLPAAFAPNGDTYLIDYGVYWVQSALDYGTQTGDWAFVELLFPGIQEFIAYLATLESPQSGLLDLSRAGRATVYIDSSSYWERRGQTTGANAFYYAALRDAATIAERLGRADLASAWRQRAARLREQANRLLYRPAEGRYIGGIYNGEASPATPQAQAAALAFGLVPAGEEQRVADALLASLGPVERPNIQILGMYMVLKGLGRIGRVDDGVDIINRYFGSMLDRGATTWWENFIADGNFTASLSHAWGSSPTWFLTTYLLGARRSGPSQWELHIPSSRWAGASGQLPLASGSLSASWSSNSCRQLAISVEAPAGSSGLLRLPATASAKIWLNGQLIWDQAGGVREPLVARAGSSLEIALGPGSHRVEAGGGCASGQ